ncbi:hypothetical protein [Nitrospira defluvii]|uniref:DUF2127 domain-containing protein n=1 Tax=Nitrospira defluvii TaxID=330214 RepID=A0ABM8RMS2_9BACT|nr:hypothetical protein [Nitrospira defluvii]CAE6761242.1 conserved membrane hypothetical protein [Nitrospira defluvii]
MLKGSALFWWRWLIVVTAGVLVFGLSMVVAPGLTRQFFSLLVFSSAGTIGALGEPAVTYIALVHGVLGAVMIGWGIALLFIVLSPFRRGSRDGWYTLAVSVAAWFIPDTVFSLWSGFWHNAVLNVVVAVLFAIPLAATYPVFLEADTGSFT